ncbi:MAG: twin-arginine translocase TatA/TatE family subunit [Desulfobacteraceae bacterium]|jgi:TatA/E family protein of Tat protein translocase
MFGIGMPELLMILAVALIIIGPKKLPELAKTLGRALGEFKRATNDLKESIHMETGLDDVGEEFKRAGNDIEDATVLVDEAPSSAETPADQSDSTDQKDQSMSRVKQAFDELNGSSDTDAEAQAPTDRDDSAQDKETS